MMKNRTKETTVEAVLYTYYKRTTPGEPDRHPVRIKVISNRKSRFYPVQSEGKNIFLTAQEWSNLEKAVRGPNKKIKEAIVQIEGNAIAARNKITQAGDPFTFDRFAKEFLHKESDKGFIALFEDYLADLLKEKRIGTYKAYNNALNAFKEFIGWTKENKRDLNVIDLSVDKLKSFDAYLKTRTIGKAKARNVGKTTIAIYMRSLKVIYNNAINTTPALQEYYPFARKQNDKGKYSIKTGSGKKGEALSIEELQALMAVSPVETSKEWEAKLLWMFSFYAQGMNFRDIALLKYKDIDLNKKTISYVRQKTKETERDEAVMVIPLSEQLHEILLKLGNTDKRQDSFIFNILAKGTDAVKQDDTIRQKIKQTNKYLKVLCEANNLPAITTYWARHSYANLLKHSGVSTDEIREMLGHSDARTTEAYLKRFDIGRKRQVNERLHSILKAS